MQNKIVILVLVFIAMDWLSGIIAHLYSGDFKSSKMREGLYHKLGIVFCFVLAFAIDYAQTVIDLGLSINLVLPVSTYISIMEIMSILENCRMLNPALDTLISKFLKGGK